MRAFILFLIWISCLSASAGQSSTNQSQAWLFVSSVRGGRPIVSIERGDFSSDRHFEFDSKMARKWRTNYGVCSKALVESAQREHLDFSSLAKILQNLRTAPENKNLAILPVAARSTKQDGELVWAVVLRWEIEKWVADGAKLVHIREFTVTQKTLKQVGFSTCG